jgi:hypothetical protein
LFELQTNDERQFKNSVYRNKVGFNRPDACLLTDYSIWKLNFPDRSISGELKVKLVKKLEKYALQLSTSVDIVAALDGKKNPSSIFVCVKNEIEVDKLEPNISLEDYLNFREEERIRGQRERSKKKREEERRKKLELTHEIIEGSIIEIEEKALKIKTNVEDVKVDFWFPKFSIANKYKEKLHLFQEFTVKKSILRYKYEEVLGNESICYQLSEHFRMKN